MTWHSILYLVLFATCVPYALIRGGAPERISALVALAATILSGIALAGSSIVYERAELGTFVVDIAALLGFVGVALFADRYWPLFVAGMQADAVTIHLAKLVQPDILPLGYAIGLSLWSYPILMLLALGTYRHRRRLGTQGVDPAWSLLASGSRNDRARSKDRFEPGGASMRVSPAASVEALARRTNGGVQ